MKVGLKECMISGLESRKNGTLLPKSNAKHISRVCQLVVEQLLKLKAVIHDIK